MKAVLKAYNNDKDHARSFLNGDSHVMIDGLSPMRAWEEGDDKRRQVVDIIMQKLEGMHL